jgi:nucleoside-triphosphatase THEP1
MTTIFETLNFRRIYATCAKALVSRCKLQIVTGPTGLGRTTTLKHFASKYSTHCHYIKFYKGQSVSHFVNELRSAITGTKSHTASLFDSTNVILTALDHREDETTTLIIIDDFQCELADFCIHVVESSKPVSLLISCSNEVLAKMKRQRAADPVIAKLLYRAEKGNVIELDSIKRDEVREICLSHGLVCERSVADSTSQIQNFYQLNSIVKEYQK